MKAIIKKMKKNIWGKWWYLHSGKNAIEYFIIVTAKIGNILPRFLEKPFIRSIDTLGLLCSRLVNVISFLFPSYFYLEGIEKNSKEQVRILYEGNPEAIEFFTDLFFSEAPSSKPLTRKQGKKLQKKKNMEYQTIDISIQSSDVFFTGHLQNKGRIIIPEHVSFILDTSQSIDEILIRIDSDITKDLKKAKKTSYHYEIRTDSKAFRLFYFQMYLPYLTWKHKGSHRTASFATILHLAEQGAELLFIKHKEDYIFGGIYLKENTKMKTYYAGLMKEKFSHLHNGIMALSYYYLIEIAKEKECKSIDFGTARPFLNDGLYVYKNKWNMNIIQTSPFFSNIFAIQIMNNHSIIDQFISKNPMHYFNNNRLDVLHKLEK